MDPLSVSQPQPQPRRRRHFSREFKAHIVAACQEPGVSVSRIALDNQLNANLVRRWIREAEQAGQTITSPAFMPLAVPVASSPPDRSCAKESDNRIRIEVPRSGGPVIVEWPAEQAHQCLALLRELLR
ncbi:transposase IS3/IS911 family protein [Alcanivorax balearicus MACL04]|uniref:Transposase IS3/IS911 family protein n=1 Tax=Alloalcanivorax balearicus MACL04 TaxID=1177182 RepID=A0ABT2R5B4_9GAMM|nr:transposase [Alloalcanivorax balearicus]MCU5784968.1 transposase IS3/IS911 family protein [Alloalcanivorax balearicus MACL04]